MVRSRSWRTFLNKDNIRNAMANVWLSRAFTGLGSGAGKNNVKQSLLLGLVAYPASFSRLFPFPPPPTFLGEALGTRLVDYHKQEKMRFIVVTDNWVVRGARLAIYDPHSSNVLCSRSHNVQITCISVSSNSSDIIADVISWSCWSVVIFLHQRRPPLHNCHFHITTALPFL